MRSLQELVRPNIWALKPYSCARDEFKGVKADAFLDANENPYPNGVNRYPDPLQEELKQAISPMKGVPVDHIFLGNGSDEAIDLPYRIFCRPGKDNVVAIDPTYGMYEVCADVNDVEYRKVSLDENYDIDPDALLAACDENTKIIFICSPNNPTGNAFQRAKIEKVIEQFQGIVIVDEAYSDFSSQRPFRFDIPKYPNLIVLATFSKAWGAAGIRLGMAFASTEIIGLYNKVKYPYNVNVILKVGADKKLRIGVKRNGPAADNPAGNWTIVDDFQLICYGTESAKTPSDDASGIEGVQTDLVKAAEIFNVNGARVATLQKGINIVRMNNGTIQKILVK